MIQRAIQAAWLLGVVFTVAVAPLAARDLRPGIIGDDDRRLVDMMKTPPAAVGQVNAAHYGRRTSSAGTLIAPDRVVTAAHRVTYPPVRRWRWVRSIS